MRMVCWEWDTNQAGFDFNRFNSMSVDIDESCRCEGSEEGSDDDCGAHFDDWSVWIWKLKLKKFDW